MMEKKHLLPVLFISCILISCSFSSENSERIDYQTLAEVTAEPILEIGESEDFLPGRLRDLVVTSDGSMLVSDWASVSIEQFNAEGEHVGTVAEEGSGPGEISSFFYLYDLGNDTVMVRQQTRKKNYYTRSANGQFEFTKAVSANQNSDRYLTIIGSGTNGNYFATAGTIIRDIQQAAKNEDDYRFTPVAVIDAAENIVEDSLHLLKSPTPHVRQTGENGINVNSVPYRYRDRFILLEDNRYLIARPDSSAFFVYNDDHTLERRISFPVKERPVTSDDLDYLLEDVNSSARSEIRNRVHDQKPPYQNVWVSANYLWLQTDDTEAGKEIVIVDLEGNPQGKFWLSPHDEVAHVEDDRIYTLHKNPEMGNSIRVYEVEESY